MRLFTLSQLYQRDTFHCVEIIDIHASQTHPFLASVTMKILEAQSAVLTNFEVYHHVVNQPQGSRRAGKKGPTNYETLHRELVHYLTTMPNPLAQRPLPYSQDCIKQLIQRLHPYELAKGEMIMIFNLRPASASALNTIIEDMEDRFDEDKQAEIVDIIAEVLGTFPPGGAAGAAEANGQAEHGTS
ncbi:DNA-directed RNA polymerase III subunit rpc9 like protein [Verticillium longisporum]|nr:DNA-directed RNA polymerase III subunit rpc9 like protein [Verticillium longisporum]